MQKNLLKTSAIVAGGAAGAAALVWLLKRPTVKKALGDLYDQACTKID